jgi:hypothetical protein
MGGEKFVFPFEKLEVYRLAIELSTALLNSRYLFFYFDL